MRSGSRPLTWCGAVLLGIVPVHGASSGEPEQNDGFLKLKSLVEAISNGSRIEAVGQISQVDREADAELEVSDRWAFVDRLLRCQSEIEPDPISAGMFVNYFVRWKCGASTYYSEIGIVSGREFAVVQNFSSTRNLADMREERLRPSAPLPPITITLGGAGYVPTVSQTVIAFGEGLVSGSLDASVAYVSSDARLLLRTRDAKTGTILTDMDEIGHAGAQRELAWIRSHVGKPSKVSCRFYGSNECEWEFPNSDSSLKAIFDIVGDQITFVELTYGPAMTVEMIDRGQ